MSSKFKLLLCEILLRERKDKATEWEKIFVDHISDKGPESRIYEELSKLSSKKQKQSNLKMCKRHKQAFAEEDIQVVNKHTERCSASLAIRKVQIKPTVRHYHTATRISKGKNDDNPNFDKDMEKMVHLPIADGNIILSETEFGSFS